MELKLGLDPGFGAIKSAYVDAAGALHPLSLPSTVGSGTLELGWLSLGQLGRRRPAAQPHTVAWDGVTYLTGPHVEAYARAVERMDFLRLADGPELRALLYTALGLLLGPGAHTAALLLGLPVEVLADRALARAIRDSLRAWLLGAHPFTVDGQAVTLTVTRLEVLAQPAGAFFAWGLDNAGQWVRPAADLDAPVGVCDLGFNTLDAFAVAGGRVQARYTGGATVGLRRSAELLTRLLKTQHGVDLSLHQADALLRERRPTLATASGVLDLRGPAEQARAASVGAVMAFLEQQWGNARQFQYVLFTGGGAEALRPDLLRQYPHGVILPDPVHANAIGLARYAQQAFKD